MAETLWVMKSGSPSQHALGHDQNQASWESNELDNIDISPKMLLYQQQLDMFRNIILYSIQNGSLFE